MREQLGDGPFADAFSKLLEDLMCRCDVTTERALFQIHVAQVAVMYKNTLEDEKSTPSAVLAMGAVLGEVLKLSADLALVQSRIDASHESREYKIEMNEFMMSKFLKLFDDMVRPVQPALADQLIIAARGMSQLEERAKYGEPSMKFA